jgi:hypothetical protein
VDNGCPSLGANGLIADHPLLDAFAREYANHPHASSTGSLSHSGPDVQDFFLWWLLNRLGNIAAGIQTAPAPYHLDLSDPEDVGKAQWLAHLIGYYAGLWLRGTMVQFDGPPKFGLPLMNTTFKLIYKQVLTKSRDVALSGSDAEAIAFSRASLRSNVQLPVRRRFKLSRLIRALPGEMGMFGYDAAYLYYLLPPSLNAPHNAQPFTQPYFTIDSTKLLDANFALGKEPFLAQAEQRYNAPALGEDEAAARLTEAIEGRPEEESLLARQQRFFTRGAMVYRVGISEGTRYRGFDQPQYDRLLAWAAYSVMHNLTNAMNGLTAYATQDAALSRQQITSLTLWWGFGLTFIISYLDSRNDGLPFSETLPRFVTANQTIPLEPAGHDD